LATTSGPSGSRAIVAKDILPQRQESAAEIVLPKAREARPEAKPRVISDRGAQFLGREQAIRPKTALTLEDAKRILGEFIAQYNITRLHTASATSPRPIAWPTAARHIPSPRSNTRIRSRSP
jgi:hypothetical protein